MPEVIDRLFRRSALARQLIGAEREEENELRAEAIAEIHRLEAERDAAVPGAMAARAAAKAKWEAATQAANEAHRAFVQSQRDLSGLSLRCGNLCDKHVRFLKQTANPAIFELLQELSGQHASSAEKSAACHWLREQAWRTPDSELFARLDAIRDQFPPEKKREV